MSLIFDVFHIIGNISWAADISALIVSLIIGFVWYSPYVFGTIWMGLVGLKKEDIESVKAKNSVLWTIPITFVIAANIAAFCKHFEYDTPSQGFLIGYDLGLVACLLMAIGYLYEQRPLALYGINAGYIIVSMSAMGLIIGAML